MLAYVGSSLMWPCGLLMVQSKGASTTTTHLDIPIAPAPRNKARREAGILTQTLEHIEGLLSNRAAINSCFLRVP